MDPDVLLERLLALTTKARLGVVGGDYEPDQMDAIELYAGFEELHGWLTRGGFAPKMWAEGFAHRVNLLRLGEAGRSKALDAGTWGQEWRHV